MSFLIFDMATPCNTTDSVCSFVILLPEHPALTGSFREHHVYKPFRIKATSIYWGVFAQSPIHFNALNMYTRAPKALENIAIPSLLLADVDVSFYNSKNPYF